MKEPGWIGLCSLCKDVVKLKVEDIDLEPGEIISGYVCEKCTPLIAGKKLEIDNVQGGESCSS